MRFSRGAQSALRAMACLARIPQGDMVTAKALSADARIPRPYLAKLLQELRHANVLESAKGPHGGFTLARPAALISLANVIEVFDGPLASFDCLLGDPGCSADARCALCRRWHAATEPEEVFLQAYSVADLIR